MLQSERVQKKIDQSGPHIPASHVVPPRRLSRILKFEIEIEILFEIKNGFAQLQWLWKWEFNGLGKFFV